MNRTCCRPSNYRTTTSQRAIHVLLYMYDGLFYTLLYAFITLWWWRPQSYNNKTSITCGQQDCFITLLNWWLQVLRLKVLSLTRAHCHEYTNKMLMQIKCFTWEAHAQFQMDLHIRYGKDPANIYNTGIYVRLYVLDSANMKIATRI